MKYITLILLLSSWSALAGQDGFLTQSADESVDVNVLKGKNTTVIPIQKSEPFHSMMPPIAVREKIFTEAGLVDSIRDLDDFDRDSLYLKLAHPDSRTAERLTKKYPALSGKTAELIKAMQIIRERGDK